MIIWRSSGYCRVRGIRSQNGFRCDGSCRMRVLQTSLATSAVSRLPHVFGARTTHSKTSRISRCDRDFAPEGWSTRFPRRIYTRRRWVFAAKLVSASKHANKHRLQRLFSHGSDQSFCRDSQCPPAIGTIGHILSIPVVACRILRTLESSGRILAVGDGSCGRLVERDRAHLLRSGRTLAAQTLPSSGLGFKTPKR
jgi:hypothetical protein